MDSGPSDKLVDEWFRQAEYDIDTARYMFDGGRYFYTVFMCHLSIEKALKGLFVARFKVQPPKLHVLLYFADKLQLELPPEMKEFVYELDGLSVPTRYPDDLRKLAATFDRNRTEEVLKASAKVLAWLKAQSPK